MSIYYWQQATVNGFAGSCKFSVWHNFNVVTLYRASDCFMIIPNAFGDWSAE